MALLTQASQNLKLKYKINQGEWMLNKKTILIFLVVIIAAIIVGPLVIPLPPLDNIVPVDQLKYPLSQFAEINGVNIHYEEISGPGENIILLHGFGSSTYTWHKVMDPLSKYGTVFAYDRPAFGLTERVIPGDDVSYNPYTFAYQTELLIRLMDENNIDQAILVGNSAGGTVALQAALDYPERIKSLILISPAVYSSGGAPKWIKPLLSTPQLDRLGPVFVRSIRDRGMDLLKMAWHDETKLTEQDIENYQKPLQVENWDIGLWEFTKSNGEANISSKLNQLDLPILVITGDDDRIVPTADSIRLADELPNAQLIVIENCGHVSQEECPVQFLKAVDAFIEE